ncbi:MAG: hypothetical protein ABI601_15625 [bacterium]
MKTPLRRLVALSAALVAVASCSTDQPTAPAAPRSVPTVAALSADLLGAVTGVVNSLVSVDGLQRNTALAAPITVSKTIGAAGGTLAIPEAGVSVTVPAGALARPTAITMTARAGKLVAYDFTPHGITFARPLVFSQSLRGTNASLLSVPFIKLGYYKDANLLTKTGGLVSELLGGLVNVLEWKFTGSIPHFSGYMLTCGRGRAAGE